MAYWFEIQVDTSTTVDSVTPDYAQELADRLQVACQSMGLDALVTVIARDFIEAAAGLVADIEAGDEDEVDGCDCAGCR